MSNEENYKRHVERLKAEVSIHDLADRLGVRRAQTSIRGGKASYYAKWRNEKSASVSVFEDGRAFHDHGDGAGGSVFDFFMLCEGVDFKEAVKCLGEMFGMPWKSEVDPLAEKKPEAMHEFIARKCLEKAEACMDYLESRKISKAVIEACIKNKTLGYNDWTSPKVPYGEPSHGGPAVAFILRTMNPGHVAAVEMRYINAEINGGVKNSCQGDKGGHFWSPNPKALLNEKVHTIYICEGPINALSIETVGIPGATAIATCGKGNIEKTDWRFLKGKRVLICLDHTDKIKNSPGTVSNGYRPGLQAAWQLHEILTKNDVSALLVDQEKWDEGVDVNDVLQTSGPASLAEKLRCIESWLIPGLSAEPSLVGKRRVYLPSHHWLKYTRFRVNEDSTQWITGYGDQENSDGTKTSTPKFEDVATFRVAAISRIAIQSANATMTGDKDSNPKVQFCVSAQVPRHKNMLVRKVFEDAHLHKMDKWEPFGSVLSQAGFRRMVSVLEATADIGARVAMNFVGLGWRGGVLSVSEGVDCYFSHPEKQCRYRDLIFPSGPVHAGRTVLDAYQKSFLQNAGTQTLVWALGGHLKVFLGFWPHLTLQGFKSSGKTTLTKKLSRTIGMEMLSSQSIDTEYRVLTSISGTSHPIGWEEFSTRSEDVRKAAVSMLQECYNYAPTSRGSEHVEYLMSAPVLIAGEDVPVKGLLGKLCQIDLNKKKAELIPNDLPVFPVRQWLEFLATKDRQEVLDLFSRLKDHCSKTSRATARDDGSNRIVENYAAVLTSWSLLTDFLNVSPESGNFGRDLIADMNRFIKSTSGDREPWVWIVETIISEIAMGHYRGPRIFENIKDAAGETRPVLLIRTAHMMDHISRTNSLRAMWDALPIKSERVFRAQLVHAGALICAKKDAEEAKEYERLIKSSWEGGTSRRVAHLVALDLAKLEEFGIYAVGDADVVPEQDPDASEPEFTGFQHD